MGIGTGRCGTTSLARIIGACRNTNVQHERFQVWWYEPDEKLGQMILEMREDAAQGILWGDVNQSIGPHIGALRSAVRGMKVVCLHRDKQGTIESFIQFGMVPLRPKEKRKWVDECIGTNTLGPSAIKAFPMIDAFSMEQAIGFYWEMYEKIMERVTEPVLHVDVTDLNDDSKLNGIMDFLEIPQEDRTLVERRKYYTREEITRKRRSAGRVGARQTKRELCRDQGTGA